MPASEPVQLRVKLPEPPVMLVEDGVQVRFVEFVVTARVTVPVKPFCGVTVIVEVPATPALRVTLVGLAVTVNVGALVTV